MTSDPFHTYREVSVQRGELSFAQAGPPPGEADSVVLAVHGITSSHMAFRATARELGAIPGCCVLAPDLRGRGRSSLPGPYGFGQHIIDLIEVIDAAGVERVVLAGHSMGAYVGARLAAEHPDRIAALVLIDGGLPMPLPPESDREAVLRTVIEQATARLEMTFATVEEYLDLWRAHPAMLNQWNDDVDAYARHDLVGEPGALRCAVSKAAVAVDCRDLMYDEPTRTALDRMQAPLHLVRAEHGLFNDDPVLPGPIVDTFVAAHPDAKVELVGGANHYTLVFAPPGPRRVAAAIEAAIPALSDRGT
jgi:lipase